LSYINELNNFLSEYKNIKIATISGRFYSMDRDNNWDRIKKSYDVIVNYSNKKSFTPSEYIEESYKKDVFDEFIEPASFVENSRISSDDAVFFMNFRSDRARQLTQAILNDQLPCSFSIKKLENIYFATMTKYYDGYI